MEREMTMAMAPRLALERGYATRPSNMRSILVSTASKASKMLVNAASAAAVSTGEGERWRAMDHVRCFVMVTACVNVWILGAFMDFFSSSSSSSSSSPTSDRLPDLGIRAIGMEGSEMAAGALVLHGGVGQGPGWSASNTAIGRALSHILGILNEIPATSRKYERMLAMADKLIADNLQHCHVALHDVTRAVLSSAFSRTCELLRRSLQRSEASASATWPSRVLRLLPLGPHLAAGYDALRLCFNGLLPLLPDTADTARGSYRALTAIAGPNSCTNEWLEAEKLAHELLWITNKMRSCSITADAILKWSFASSLASLTLTAHPRVQGPIVKISALLLRELAHGEWEAPREVKFRMLLVWLPILCYASNGVTCPVLMGLERMEMEMVVEDLIASLPWEDQEVILRNWLEDFAATNSDWPNLQRCFDRWCRNSRKLLF